MMTRHKPKVSLPLCDGNPAVLSPLRPVLSRTQELVLRLREEITSGRLMPDARLPTEQVMASSMGVSRTVVREAVAALKAEGLVITRQGSGAFVATNDGRRGFRIDPNGLGSLAEVLHVLELRQAVEIQAAALASERATAKAVRAIETALVAFETAIKQGENAVPEDYAFHKAIARSTANPHFVKFLEFLGPFIIPRQSIRVETMTSEKHTAYLKLILAEHRTIYEAIAAREPDAARDAMLTHLTRSSQRYRTFASTA